ncbi:aldo/keto reductase [uncultured Lentibacter sp.]|jgi:aryl-alcohol dehydrogenase-like predicted oxidoreductase|uniref:aldo/keto reductase n=1 Tax=uncultured Lentibacter sp. TaxID=1659309 RepID=UPI00262A50BC|nr:aldo/keto reductase [uncultured Lentibacter sp.]
MKQRELGRTGIFVSEMCLGTMTFGTQTGAAEAHAQMDMALAHGVNFWDCAEMYPVNPLSKETQGDAERILGDWFERTGRRGEVVLATKHSGAGYKNVRDGAPISAQTIPEAVEGSLKRLKTDVIDLYQFHWPNRGSYMFRQNWTYDPSGQDRAETMAHMEDTLGALQREVARGTIRAFGLSNESAWGTCQWLAAAERVGGPRVASVQNEYSLLCRLYDTDMAEMSVNEDVGLLAFSPLAAGFLSGKYQGGQVPEASRMSLVPEMGGRKSARVLDAVAAYLAIAETHGLDPVQMALAWVLTRPFMGSSIFGATTLGQLEHALGAADVSLSKEVLRAIDAAHKLHPMPY